MLELETYLDPLFRPPLCLALVASALKYVASVAILGEPLLLTRGDYLRQYEETGTSATRKRLIRITLQLLFVYLALNNFMLDITVLLEGFPRLHMLERVHLTMMVLAFSPNTVAAVAGMFIPFVKISWNVGMPIGCSRICMLSDALVLVYVVMTSLLYLFPLILISAPYVIMGGCSIGYASVVDVVTLPYHLYSDVAGTVSSICISMTILSAFVLSHFLVMGIIGGQVVIFSRRYPDLAQQINEDGTRITTIKPVAPYKIPQHILGYARELKDMASQRSIRKLDSKTEEAELTADGAHNDFLMVEMLATTDRESGKHTEKCILNDQALAALFYVKVSACIYLPTLQLFVITAAKFFLGSGLWTAAEESIRERSWTHYIDHVRHSGAEGLLPLLWYYL